MTSPGLIRLALVVALVGMSACGLTRRAGEGGLRSHPSHKKVAVPTTPRVSGSAARPLGMDAAAQGARASAAALFQSQCSSCHGTHGEGGVGPPLATPSARAHFGNSQSRMAAFIQQNMPFNHPRSLTAGQARDLAAYIWALSTAKGKR